MQAIDYIVRRPEANGVYRFSSVEAALSGIRNVLGNDPMFVLFRGPDGRVWAAKCRNAGDMRQHGMPEIQTHVRCAA